MCDLDGFIIHLNYCILLIIVCWLQYIGDTLYQFCYNICWFKTCIHHSFVSNNLQFLAVSAKIWFECIPSFVICIFEIPFLKAYLLLFIVIENFIIQVDILLVGVGVIICSRDISQFLKVVENSIYWFSHIKSHIFVHILMMGMHMRRDFSISVKEMLGDYVNDLLDGVSVAILQDSDVPCADICDGFLL